MPATAQIHIRALPKTKSLLLSAVEVSGAQNLTDYILRAAVEKAHTDLANKTAFSLDARGWAEFIKMLDAPARDMPGLKKLLTTPSIFERNSKA